MTSPPESHPCRFQAQGCDFTSPRANGEGNHARSCKFNPDPTAIVTRRTRTEVCHNCGVKVGLGSMHDTSPRGHRQACHAKYPCGVPVLGDLPGQDRHVEAVQWVKAVARQRHADEVIPAEAVPVPLVAPPDDHDRAFTRSLAVPPPPPMPVPPPPGPDVEAIAIVLRDHYPAGFDTSDLEANAKLVTWLLEVAQG